MEFLDTSTSLGARVDRQLNAEVVAWLTTVGASTGTPQPSLIWFVRQDSELLILSQPNKPKLKNIKANPRVAFNFDSGAQGDEVAVFTGSARIDPDGPTDEEYDAFVKKYANRMPKVGYTPESFRVAYSVLIRVTPQKIRGF